LIFADQGGIGDQISRRLVADGRDVITVKVGEEFTNNGDSFVINPVSVKDFETLFKELIATDRLPATIVILWSVFAVNEKLDNRQVAEHCLSVCFYPLLNLAQAISNLNITAKIQISVVINDLQAVSQDDRIVAEKAVIIGPCRTIPLEIANLSCNLIDIKLPCAAGADNAELIERLTAELAVKAPDFAIAYRGSDRFIMTLDAMPIEVAAGRPQLLRERGVYLITGGLGGIGLELAGYLAETAKARLILLARSEFPDKRDWQKWLTEQGVDDQTSIKIRKLMAMENAGADVMVARVDVADREQLLAAIAKAKEQFGPINGVIHAAGVAQGNLIQMLRPEIIASELAPKVAGTINLDELFDKEPLDLFVLCSSLNSFMPRFGQAGYCSANSFLDAYAQKNAHRRERLTLSINWGMWGETGMSARGEMAKQFDGAIIKLAILSHEGVEAFRRAISASLPQIAVSSLDLNELNEMMKIGQALPANAAAATDRTLHSRPRLSSNFVAPRNEAERKIAEVWQQLLAIDQIGVFDNFFDLGGNSLIAIQLLAKLKIVFPDRTFSTNEILNALTVAGIAEALTGAPPPAQVAKVKSNLLAQIKAGGGKSPLYLVHAIGGTASFYYYDLVKYIDANVSIYGIQAQGIDGQEAPLTSIEAMAERYLEAISAVQTEGPYLIGGASFGGMVAYEMARQLLEKNERVALLFLIDTPGPEYMPRRLNSDIEILLYMAGDGVVTVEELRELDAEARMRFTFERMRSLNKLPGEIDFEQMRNFMEIGKININAMFDYQPKRFPGRLTFFRAREWDGFNAEHPELAWLELASEAVEIQVIGGNHRTMLDQPQVRGLAKRLSNCLQSCQ
jgi:thioesterase domain-containing protein/NAD(P)-dependent dehydrogenase (short-subunit alcohol dehydrogenase family)